MTELNPVQLAIREHVAAHYDQWRKRAEAPSPTRAGLRYLGANVATLIAPALDTVGLHVVEEGYETRLFVTSAGKQITRARLGDLIAGALADHPDRVLRASIGTASFWEHVADRMPYFEGDEIERAGTREARPTKTSTDYSRERHARERAAEEASARAFLEAVRPRLAGDQIDARDLYAAAVTNIERRLGETITADDDSEVWTVPGRRLFYALADEILGKRVRRARGYVYAVARAVRRVLWRERPLRPGTVEVLRDLARTVRGEEPIEERPRRRLGWRDRPLRDDTERVLRGLASIVIEAEEVQA